MKCNACLTLQPAEPTFHHTTSTRNVHQRVQELLMVIFDDEVLQAAIDYKQKKISKLMEEMAKLENE